MDLSNEAVELYTFRQSTQQQSEAFTLALLRRLEKTTENHCNGKKILKLDTLRKTIVELTCIQLKCPKFKQKCFGAMDRLLKTVILPQPGRAKRCTNIIQSTKETTTIQSPIVTHRLEVDSLRTTARSLQNSPSIFAEYNEVSLRQIVSTTTATRFGSQEATVPRRPYPSPLYGHEDSPLFSQPPSISLTPDDILPLSNYFPLNQQVSAVCPSMSGDEQTPSSSGFHESTLSTTGSTLLTTTTSQTTIAHQMQVETMTRTTVQLCDSSTNTTNDSWPQQISGFLSDSALMSQYLMSQPTQPHLLTLTESEMEQLSRRIGIGEFDLYQILYDIRHSSQDPNMQSVALHSQESMNLFDLDGFEFGTMDDIGDDISVIHGTPPL